MPILDSNQSENDAAPEPAESTHLLDETLKFVKEHPVEVAAGAGAIGAIILLKKGAFAAAEKEIAPLANLASESGTLNFAKGTVESMPKSAESFLAFDHSGYKHVPIRNMVGNIRMQEGVIMRTSEGPSRIVFGDDHAVQHILFNKNATAVEKADLVMTASYADLIKSDVLAAKAAGTVPHKMFGFIGKPVERMATPEQMHENAIAGAKAYFEMNTKGANHYTSYLTQRFGPATKDLVDWGKHITTDARSTESGWNRLGAEATKVLEESGIPISPLNRALAANPTILNATPWTRRSAIEGGAEYIQAHAQHSMPEGLNVVSEQLWYGHQAQAVTPEVVNTLGAVAQGIGKEACRDFQVINRVATTVGAHGKPEDYIQAYKAIKSGEEVVARMSHLH